MSKSASAPEIQVNAFESSGGASVFQIPFLAFPGLWGFVYVVLYHDPLLGEMRVLIDTGSGYGEANAHIEQGFKIVSSLLGYPFSFADLTHILITHGHIDHFGGLNFIRQRSNALLGIHELDRRILNNYPERLSVIARRLNDFLIEAGVNPERRHKLLDMYRITKSLFTPEPVDFTFQAMGMRLGPLELLHVPGHCAGHVVIRLNEILFSGDHVLEGISPHQAPEQLTLSTGLDHYLNSLESLREWAQNIQLTLPGHREPIRDLEKRIYEICELHRDRLQKVLDLLVEPSTITEVSKHLFGDVHGYNILLALEEAGAHFEYLYQRGLLEISNLDELEHSQGPVRLLYRCVQCKL